MNKKHLIWIIPICLLIGFYFGYKFGINIFIEDLRQQGYMNICKLF